MRHLHAVPSPRSPAGDATSGPAGERLRTLTAHRSRGADVPQLRSANPHDLPAGATQPALDLVGIPDLPPSPSPAPAPPVADEPDQGCGALQEPRAEVAAAIAQAESLFDGVDSAEWLQVAAGFYIDGDGNARTRHRQLHAL